MRLPIAVVSGVLAAAPALAQPIPGHGISGSGTGNVNGVGASTNNDLPVYSDATGKNIKDSSIPLASVCIISNGCTYAASVGFADGGTWNSGGVVAHGPINTTSSLGLELNGTLALVPMSIANSPTIFPDGGNTYGAGAIYMPAPVVETATLPLTSSSPNQYGSMRSAYFTLSGSLTNHVGGWWEGISVSGGTYAAEVNSLKEGIIVQPGAVVTGFMEPFEPAVENYGTVGTVWGINPNIGNLTTSAVAGTISILHTALVNYNPSNMSVSGYYGMFCSSPSGGGYVPVANMCWYNSDPAEEVASVGHWGFRTTGTLTMGAGCGTLATYSGDTLGAVTIASGATCTVGFAKGFTLANTPPVCIVVSENGGTFDWIEATGSLAITNAGGASAKADWFCGGLW